ncbi:hypothetical protein RDV89_14210 [Nocardioides zeae]|uniref:Zinc ribbon domain-containing protein n=1 Tax=Nocardioides imazamoxiresistens TaxID=3231893 RepID=A0ABU3PYB6_9ACTN|nr:hypothetical protein [Nocardioides zeae]MDT9594233.1 hypothetical protein [Nocardioides zeae]
MLQTLTCPVCRTDVAPSAAACRSCHLPMRDVTRHQPTGSERRSRVLRGVRRRLWGAAIYAGIVVWCLAQLPTAASFVVPGAAVGAALHVVLGRPIVAALAFVLIVVVAPFLLVPSMGADILDDLGTWTNRS